MPHVSLNKILDDIQACPEGEPIRLPLVVRLYRLLFNNYRYRQEVIDRQGALDILSRRLTLKRPLLGVVLVNIFVSLLLTNYQVDRVANYFSMNIWFRLELVANELPAIIPTNIILVFNRVIPMRIKLFNYMNQFYGCVSDVDLFYHEKILSLTTLIFNRKTRILRLALSFGFHLDGFVRLMLQSNKSLATSAAECLCTMVDSNQVDKQIVLQPPMFLEALSRLLQWNDEFASYYAGCILLHACRLSDAFCGDVIVHPALLNLLQILKQHPKTHDDVCTVATEVLRQSQIRQVAARITIRKQRRTAKSKRNASSACLFQTKHLSRKRKQNPETEAYLGSADCAI